MKITLIILQTLDGLIVRNQDDDMSWGSHEDKHFFRNLTKQIGTMIMGANTYEKMPVFAFKDRYSLVFTNEPKKFQPGKAQNIEFFTGSPVDGVNHLKDKGIEEAALIGGGNLNNQFLKAGLVNELYITVAPRIFAKGIKGYGDNALDIKLKLLESQILPTNEVLLHYLVLQF